MRLGFKSRTRPSPPLPVYVRGSGSERDQVPLCTFMCGVQVLNETKSPFAHLCAGFKSRTRACPRMHASMQGKGKGGGERRRSPRDPQFRSPTYSVRQYPEWPKQGILPHFLAKHHTHCLHLYKFPFHSPHPSSFPSPFISSPE